MRDVGVGDVSGALGADLDLEACLDATGCERRSTRRDRSNSHIKGVDEGIGKNGAAGSSNGAAPWGDVGLGLCRHGERWLGGAAKATWHERVYLGVYDDPIGRVRGFVASRWQLAGRFEQQRG